MELPDPNVAGGMGSLGHVGVSTPKPPQPLILWGGRRLQVKVAAKSMTLGVPELTSSATLGLYGSSPNLPGREGYFLIWK